MNWAKPQGPAGALRNAKSLTRAIASWSSAPAPNHKEPTGAGWNHLSTTQTTRLHSHLHPPLQTGRLQAQGRACSDVRHTSRPRSSAHSSSEWSSGAPSHASCQELCQAQALKLLGYADSNFSSLYGAHGSHSAPTKPGRWGQATGCCHVLGWPQRGPGQRPASSWRQRQLVGTCEETALAPLSFQGNLISRSYAGQKARAGM